MTDQVKHEPCSPACRHVTCGRCGQHTNNSSQGHYWATCKVDLHEARFHFCCPGDCELHGTGKADSGPAVGDVLHETDPEPPVGTIVQLRDGEKWQRLDAGDAWCWSGEHHGYQKPCWTWGRVTFDGPVVVAAVAGGGDRG